MTVADLSVRFDSSPVARGVQDLRDAASASREAATAVDAVGTATERAFGSFDKGKSSGDKLLTALERIEAEVKKVTAGVSPLSAALDKLDASINKLGKSQGGFSAGTGNATKVFKDHKNAVDDAAKATENFGKSQKQVANDIKIMQYQLIDVAQGLAMGQSPLMIAMQQGGQIAQAGGLRGAMAAYRALPVGVRYGGPALLAGGLGFAAYNAAQRESLNTERSGYGAGVGAGLSQADVERLAKSGGYDNLRGPAHPSYAQSLSLVQGLRGSGVGEQGIVEAQKRVLDMSVTINKTVDETIQTLSEGAKDPAKFYTDMAGSIGRVNADVRKNIEDTQRAGDKTGAFAIAMRELEKSLPEGKFINFNKSANASLEIAQRLATVWSYGIHGVVRSVDELTNASGRNAEAVKSDAEKIKDAEEAKKRAIDSVTDSLKQQARQIAIDAQTQYGLSKLDPLSQQIAATQRTYGGGPKFTPEEQKAYDALDPALKKRLALNDAETAGNIIKQNTLEISKALTEQARANRLTMDAETRAIGQSAGEQARLQYIAQARITAGAGGKKISEENEQQILKEAAAYGKLVESLARARTEEQLRFDRSQLGRTAGDQQIASALRPLGGIDNPRNAALADEMRLTQDLQELKSTLSSGVSGFLTAIRQGAKPGEALANQAGQMVDKAINKLTDEGLSRMFKWGMGQFGLDKLSTTAQMNVQAGVVHVNGAGAGVGGVPGVGGSGGALSPGGTAPISPVTSGPIPDVGTTAARAFSTAGGIPAGSKLVTPGTPIEEIIKGVPLSYKSAVVGRGMASDSPVLAGMGGNPLPITVRPNGTPSTFGYPIGPQQTQVFDTPTTQHQAPTIGGPAAAAAMPDFRGARTALELDALGKHNIPFFGDSVSFFDSRRGGGGASALKEAMETKATTLITDGADKVKGALDTTATGVQAGGGDLVNSIMSIAKGAMSGLGGMFGGAGGGGGVPGNAAGTSYWRGGLTWVGEKGPELARLPTGTEIYANHRLPSLSPSQQAAPQGLRVTHNVYNQSNAQVETRERQNSDGSYTMDTVVRATEKSIAGRMARGQGDMKDAVRTNQVATNRG